MRQQILARLLEAAQADGRLEALVQASPGGSWTPTPPPSASSPSSRLYKLSLLSPIRSSHSRGPRVKKRRRSFGRYAFF